MNKLNEILLLTQDIPYMEKEQALELSRIINQYKIKHLCELGTFHGKGSLCAAAVMEERGEGEVTTFDSEQMISTLNPTVDLLAKRFKLSHRINSIVTEKSYSWELAKLIEANDEPIFDCVYIDGSHDYAGTALQFYLSNELAKPGCVFIFDDINWSASTSDSTGYYQRVVCSEEWDQRSVNMFVDHTIKQEHLVEIPTTVENWRVLHNLFI